MSPLLMSVPEQKCVADGYDPRPFRFLQTYKGKDGKPAGVRLAAWTPQVERTTELFYSVLDRFPNLLGTQLKSTLDGGASGGRYQGTVSRPKLRTLIEEMETPFFTDGHLQISIMRPDTGEYLTLDDHGIVFVYSLDPLYARLCAEAGLEEREEKLIYELPHYHISPPDHERTVSYLVEGLVLESY
jgi:hypothetical protein